MSLIDVITVIFFLSYFYMGFKNGVLKTLLGPLALIFCLYFSYHYFFKTQNVKLSLLLCLLGPFITSLTAGMVISMWESANNVQRSLTLGNRFSGGMLNVAWGGALYFFMLFCVAIIPPELFNTGYLRKEVMQSFTFEVMQKSLNLNIPDEMDYGLFQDPEIIGKVGSSHAFRHLRQDQRIQDIINDEDIQEQIRKRDFEKLLSHPKVYSVMRDRDLIISFFKVHQMIMAAAKNRLDTQPESENFLSDEYSADTEQINFDAYLNE